MNSGKLHKAIKALNEAEQAISQAGVEVQEARRQLQTMCKHDGNYTFNPDPSGNNDSSRACHICGIDF